MEIFEITNIGSVHLPEHTVYTAIAFPVHIISLIDRWGQYEHLCAINAPDYIWKS